MITRVPPGTWETLTVPRRRPDGSNRYNKLPDDPSASASGAERGRMADAPRYRQAKETKRGEMTVRESQRPIVAVKQGNGASRTLGIEGAPSYGHAVGNTTRTQSLNRVSPNTA